MTDVLKHQIGDILRNTDRPVAITQVAGRHESAAAISHWAVAYLAVWTGRPLDLDLGGSRRNLISLGDGHSG